MNTINDSSSKVGHGFNPTLVLINKVFRKLQLIKNVFNKKCGDKIIFLFSIKLDDSWHRKFTLKVRFCQQIDW